MGKRRSSTSSSQLEQVSTPPSLAKHSRQSWAEPNNTSTLKPPQSPSPAPGTRQLSPSAVKTTPSKKAKSTHAVIPTTSKTCSLKNAKGTSGGSRRSSRLRNVGESPSDTTPNKEIERIIEDITSTDSEKEEDEQLPLVEETQGEKDPVPESGVTGEKSSQEVIRLCEEQQRIIAEQQKSIAELKAEISENNERPSDLKYKSLYFDSKKEVDALTKETHQLRTEMEFSRGRSMGLREAMITMLVAMARTGSWDSTTTVND
ncbi:hypothetical protein LINGRAHAP2_LOCUS17828 [Linum grandiflorum]